MPGQHLMSLEEEHVLELAFSQLVFLMELLFLHLPHCRLSRCTHQSTQQHGQCQFHNRTRHKETAHLCLCRMTTPPAWLPLALHAPAAWSVSVPWQSWVQLLPRDTYTYRTRHTETSHFCLCRMNTPPAWLPLALHAPINAADSPFPA